MAALLTTIARTFLAKGRLVPDQPLNEVATHIVLRPEHRGLCNVRAGSQLGVWTQEYGTGVGDARRTYSAWQCDRHSGDLHSAPCQLSDGSGHHWARNVDAGDEVLVSKPEVKFGLADAATPAVFIGDTSAQGHLYTLSRGLLASAPGSGIVHADAPDHVFSDHEGSTPFDTPVEPAWVVDAVIDRIEHLDTTRHANTVFHINGEAGVVKALHHHLYRKPGIPQARIRAKAFWKPGRTRMEQ
jgi:NADPH-dependent ferric siderophore reductase